MSRPKSVWETIVLVAIVVLMLATSASARWFARHQLPYGQNQELISNDELPEDGGKCYFSLFLSNPNPVHPLEVRVKAMIEGDPGIGRIVASTHSALITPEDVRWATYRPYIGGVVPVILLQEPDGTIVYKATGNHIPHTLTELRSEMLKAIKQHFPAKPTIKPAKPPLHYASYAPNQGDHERLRPWCRPRPKPDPDPVAKPDQPPSSSQLNVTVAPDTSFAFEEQELEEENEFPVGAVLACGAVAAGLALLVNFKKSVWSA